ncbi:MAG: SDR family NAD(P)-dependent oxidoreductase, partial [Methylobacter sp.]
VLHLVQALVSTPSAQARTLTLVTRGAQAVYSISDNPEHRDANASERETPLQPRLNLLQAPLLGLGKVIALEHPELQCLRIDLDPELASDSTSVTHEAQQLINELHRQTAYGLNPAQATGAAPAVEDQIAYRQGQRYVPRLERCRPPADAAQRTQTAGTDRSAPQRRLQLNGIGIDCLQLRETTLPAPQAGQLQIRVTASGLNFKDVLHALGMLQFPGCQPDDIPFGFEGAGIVSHIGQGVEGYRIGDRVMAVLTPGSMADHVNVDARYVIKTPDRLGDLDAAAIPLAYLTASYGLEHLAQLQPGERILIHAAAGGVGQAAIQIAKLHGLDIHASAHPDKWPLLQAQGIQHLYHSRQADYSDAINAATDGHGVDIVLNSLNGDFIPENLRCLAKGGRYIEIGKLGILSPEQMQQQRPDVSYHIFDLGEVGQQQPELIQRLFTQLGERLQQTLSPLPVQSYPLEKAADAFQCMAQARHTGKLVLSHQTGAIKPEHSYLITGGLGGLGLKLAEWLIQQGATHLVLNSINPANEQVQEQLNALRQHANVELIVADIGQADHVQDLFEHIQAGQPPLAGIIHAAGKLDDGMLQQLDWTRFASVLRPKLHGSWHLHRYSQHLNLDFFIEFSSATALLGAPGQGNYAAANAFQDALAHQRKWQGLPALSINWGPWGEVGMAARLSSNASHWQTQGIEPINPQTALQALLQSLHDDAPQIALMQIDWPRFSRHYPSALLSNLAQVQTSAKSGLSFIERLNALPAEQQRDYLNEWLREQICTVLALPKSTPIESRQRLFDFGLDSLMSVELKNRLDNAIAKKLRSTLIFDYPTLEALSKHLAEQVLAVDDKKQDQASEPVQNDADLFELGSLLDALENSSDDEITQQLMN